MRFFFCKLLHFTILQMSRDDVDALLINASESGNVDDVRALLGCCDPRSENYRAFDQAVLNGHAEVVRAMLEWRVCMANGATHGRTIIVRSERRWSAAMQTSCRRFLHGEVQATSGATRERKTTMMSDGHHGMVTWTSCGRCLHGEVQATSGVTHVW